MTTKRTRWCCNLQIHTLTNTSHSQLFVCCSRFSTMSSESRPQGFSTRAIHAGQEPDPSTGAVSVPISLATTFAQGSPGVPMVRTASKLAGNGQTANPRPWVSRDVYLPHLRPRCAHLFARPCPVCSRARASGCTPRHHRHNSHCRAASSPAASARASSTPARATLLAVHSSR